MGCRRCDLRVQKVQDGAAGVAARRCSMGCRGCNTGSQGLQHKGCMGCMIIHLKPTRWRLQRYGAGALTWRAVPLWCLGDSRSTACLAARKAGSPATPTPRFGPPTVITGFVTTAIAANDHCSCSLLGISGPFQSKSEQAQWSL